MYTTSARALKASALVLRCRANRMVFHCPSGPDCWKAGGRYTLDNSLSSGYWEVQKTIIQWIRIYPLDSAIHLWIACTQTEVVIFFFLLIVLFRKPLRWRSINPPGFLYLSRALDGLRREKQRVCEQATFWTTGPCSVKCKLPDI